MSQTVTYQSCTILSAPVHDANSNQWKLRISISWGEEGRTTSRTFWMPIAYSTELEADSHGIAYGQRIIDGNVPGLGLE
jgi:hypothetical protein